MQTATLGGLIKDYRIRKRLSQLEVSMNIGWSDTTRLSKIEQGRVSKPSRETVEKIISALQLTPKERGDFLLVGGYLPTDQEIKKIIREFGNRVLEWPHPAYLIDFSWRVLLINNKTAQIFGLSPAFVKKITKNKPNLLEAVIYSKETLP